MTNKENKALWTILTIAWAIILFGMGWFYASLSHLW